MKIITILIFALVDRRACNHDVICLSESSVLGSPRSNSVSLARPFFDQNVSASNYIYLRGKGRALARPHINNMLSAGFKFRPVGTPSMSILMNFITTPYKDEEVIAVVKTRFAFKVLLTYSFLLTIKRVLIKSQFCQKKPCFVRLGSFIFRDKFFKTSLCKQLVLLTTLSSKLFLNF